ncbi:MAG: CHAT domain-containing protein, partial [Planctomycetota bacterium]
MNLIFSTLSERQQEGYLNSNFRTPLNVYLSVFTDPSEQIDLYQNLFIYRGITSRTLRNRTRATIDPNAASLFAQLKEARTFYANLYLSPNPKLSLEVQQKLLKMAIERKENLERQLCSVSESFRKSDALSKTTFTDLHNTLNENTAIVDFLFYQHITDWKNGIQEERVIAFVIKKESPVLRIDLGLSLPIRSATKAFRQQLQSGREIQIDDLPADQYLTKLLWNPISETLSDKQSLYLIPDEDLAFIPFEALRIEEEGELKYLTEIKSIAYLSSPQDLIEFAMENEVNPNSFLCLGNVAYSESPELSTSSTSEGLRTEDSVLNAAWSELPGTAKECEFLLNSFQSVFPTQSNEYLGQKKASKALLLEKAVGKRYLHWATHGFFKTIPKTPMLQGKQRSKGGLISLWTEDEEPGQRSKIPEGVNPMLYSGIVLAGANLDKKEEQEKGKEEGRLLSIVEGFLTAEELAGMNLKGTELLTLSACETALGEGLSGQGVSGLRLATQVAGARATLLSL